MTIRDVDVLVAGCGPAGAVTAWALARQGLDVLIVGDDTMHPAHGHGYDVIVTDAALAGLRTLTDLEQAPLTPAVPLRLGFSTDSPRMPTHQPLLRWRSLPDAVGATARSDRLRLWLRCGAVAAGAGFLEGRVQTAPGCTEWAEHRYHDVTVGGAQGMTHLRARHLVMATGVAHSIGHVLHGAGHTQGVASVQRFDYAMPSGDIRLLLLAPSEFDPRTRPSCVWVIPCSDGGCTIGSASLGGADDTPQTVIGAARTALIATDPAFATARPVGPIVGAPLNTGFAPERSVEAGGLLIGDAAGLVNPFTGEGLSHAIHSGLLAASAIATNRADGAAAADAYRRRLASAFVGYFETARHAARRYHLAWRVLTETSDSDHPFFAKGRRSMLLADGIAGATATDRVALPAAHTVLMAPFLAACNEIAVKTVRAEWPFIARLLIDNGHTHYVPLRPAVPFFAGLLASGAPPATELAVVAAAIELAHLGALAFICEPGSRDETKRGVDWPAATAILAGDFLLAQATRLISEYAPETTWPFCDWLNELTDLRSRRRLGSGGHIENADLFGSLFEFPARIGAELGGCSASVVSGLRTCGNQCGRAFLFAEDALALDGYRTRLDSTLTTMLQGDISTLPDLLRRDLTMRRLRTTPGLHAQAVTAVATAKKEAQEAAYAAASLLPHQASAQILHSFATVIAEPKKEFITPER